MEINTFLERELGYSFACNIFSCLFLAISYGVYEDFHGHRTVFYFFTEQRLFQLKIFQGLPQISLSSIEHSRARCLTDISCYL